MRCCLDDRSPARPPSRAWFRAAEIRTAPNRRLRARHLGLLLDVPSNPNTFGDFNPRGESFEGPPSTAVFAENGFIYLAPDYLGLGDSTVPRHRYFHAETEASSALDLLAAARGVLADLSARRNGELFVFGFSQGGHSALALQRELERRGRG